MLATVPAPTPAGRGFESWPVRGRMSPRGAGTCRGWGSPAGSCWPLTHDSGAGAGAGRLGAVRAEVQVFGVAADPHGTGLPDLGAGGEVAAAQLPAQLPAPLVAQRPVVAQHLPAALLEHLDVPLAGRGATRQPPHRLRLRTCRRRDLVAGLLALPVSPFPLAPRALRARASGGRDVEGLGSVPAASTAVKPPWQLLRFIPLSPQTPRSGFKA